MSTVNRYATCGTPTGCDACRDGDKWSPDARGTSEDVVVYCPRHNSPTGPQGCIECLHEDMARDLGLDLRLERHPFPVDGDA